MTNAPLLLLLALAAPPSAAEARSRADHAIVPHCQVFLIHDVSVPALETGPLVKVLFREGNVVKQDALMAQIDDKQAQLTRQSAQAERDAAQAKADDDIDVRYATKSFELADAELRQDMVIKQRSSGAVSDAEIRRKELLRTREQLGIDRAKLDRQIAQFTADTKNAAVETAGDNIARRRIVAPFNGLVVEVLKHESEWVNAGETVFRVIQMDRLRVDGFLSGDEYNPVDIAQRKVTVEVQLANDRRERFEGEVVFVTPLVQGGNKYRIRAEVDNRFERNEPLLRPGMTPTMIIHLR